MYKVHILVALYVRHPHNSDKLQFGLSVPPQRHQPLACLAPIAPPHLIVCPHSKKMTDEWAAATLCLFQNSELFQFGREFGVPVFRGFDVPETDL